MLAKIALFFFGIALWDKGLTFYAYYLLPLAWILSGGLGHVRQILKDPFVLGMLALCLVLALGILWSDHPKLGFRVWRRYVAFLIFIPYLGLLTKERLPWAIGGALIGYFGVLMMGLYQWLVFGNQGIPVLRMPYLHFSSMLGVGVILAVYLGGKIRELRSILWLFAALLLFVQVNQHARGILIATLVSSLFLVILLYKKQIKRLLLVVASLIMSVSVFAYSSPSFHQRLIEAKQDIGSTEQGNYSSSVGYRFAMWDVGIHGISERPFFGHGTGMATRYFENTVDTYKGGIYRNLLQFHPTTYHYHNDWIEIGMHLGLLGLFSYFFFLFSWFKTFITHGEGTLGAALICFVFFCGLTDYLVFFRQTMYLLVVITALSIYIGSQRFGFVHSRPESR
ncbi:O-antigen ligase family protein [Nitrosospira multiformis]|uniref:O-antigen ligase family protein n=1 Tax=Nitrosospira multiformis TaxID=1231 RepID=UPI00210ABF3F|nr:O-antigen ligase family protein [Nitrosospira multiformis]